MRVFHSLVFDENIESATPVYTDASWNSQLGLPDKLTIFALTDTASGTPALHVAIEEGPDQVHWLGKMAGTATTTADIYNQTVPTTANQVFVGRDAGTNPSAAFVRLRITLTGASAKSHVRIWVTGRGEQIP